MLDLEPLLFEDRMNLPDVVRELDEDLWFSVPATVRRQAGDPRFAIVPGAATPLLRAGECFGDAFVPVLDKEASRGG